MSTLIEERRGMVGGKLIGIGGGGGGSAAAAAPVAVSVLAHMLFMGIAILMLVWTLSFRGGLALHSNNKQKIFNMHPLFTILGFVLLSGEAMIVYKSNSGPRKQQKAVHGFLNLAALVCGSIGVAAVFKYHHDLHLPNMYTLHSWFGISTLCLFALQLIFGFISFVFPRIESSKRAKVSPWHIMLGLIIFSMAILTSLTGLTERFIFLHINHLSREAVLINFTALLIFFFGASVFSILLQRYTHT